SRISLMGAACRLEEGARSPPRFYCDGFGPMTALPSGLRRRSAGLRASGAAPGLSDTRQASRSTSGRLSGQAHCEATGAAAGAGLAHAGSRTKATNTIARLMGSDSGARLISSRLGPARSIHLDDAGQAREQ